MAKDQKALPDELRLLVRAVDENENGHWQKVQSLLLRSPVKCTFRFSSGSFYGVKVAQVPSAYVNGGSVDAAGCPLALRRAVEYCSTDRLFIDAVAAFRRARLDVSVTLSGDSFLGATLAET